MLALSPSSVLLLSRYEAWMVALSYFIAVLASVLAMHLADLASQFERRQDRRMAMIGGAIALGAATWSMHFIGMMAFELCATIQYEPWLTFVSLLPAFVASWAAMRWITQPQHAPHHLWFSGIIIGAGIGLMHYSGMLAIQTSALLSFKPWWVLSSVVAAVLLSVLALWFRQVTARFARLQAWRKLITGAVLGGAITIMHYVGMAAATFSGVPEFPEPVPTIDRWYLSTLITLGAMTLIGAVMAMNMLARQRQLARELQFKEHQMWVIFQNAVDAIVITDAKGTINMVNRAFEGMFGYPAQRITGSAIHHIIPAWRQLYQHRKRRLQDGTDRVVSEHEGVHADGHQIPLRITLTRVMEQPHTFYISFLTDITHFRSQQDALQRQLTEDPLTGLFNRRGLLSMMRGITSEPQAQQAQRGIVVLFVDLDGFKAVNDTLGHAAGDEVLVTVSQRIPQALRAHDTVCRYGGDEFVILCRYEGPAEANDTLPAAALLRPASAQQAAQTADLASASGPEQLVRVITDKLLAVIQQPIRLHAGQEIQVGCSIGVAYGWPQDLPALEALLTQADSAMYHAKKGQLGKVVYARQAA